MELVKDSPVRVEVHPPEDLAGAATLAQLQLTEKSALGAIVRNCGGLLVDGGWIRILGNSAAAGLGITRVNEFPTATDPNWRPTDGLIVGYDVLGGVFAISTDDAASTGRPGAIGQVGYFAPDTLEWESLEISHSQWLNWLLSGGTTKFYEALRWPGWEQECQGLAITQGIAVYPFLWSNEARADLSATSRRPVPIAELTTLATEFTSQAGLPSPGFLGHYA
jgi:hypothetical protein